LGIELGDPSKPLYYIHCTIHAREWISTTTCLWIIDQLLNVDPQRDELLKLNHWIIVPVHNIDGYNHAHTADRLWRKNRQPNSGTSCVGTDLNRNYAYGWGQPGADSKPCGETYRGFAPFSSPETDAESTFLQKYADSGSLFIYLDIHAYGALWLSAWGYTRTHPDDYPAMEKQMLSSVDAARDVNGRTYEHGTGADLYVTSGDTIDYLYGELGIVQAYTIECYGTSFVPRPTEIPLVGSEVWAGARQIALDLSK